MTRVWYALGGILRRRGYDEGTLPENPTNPRDALIYDTYKPSVFTTGTLSGITRTDYNKDGANLIINKSGTILRNLNIWGDIKIQAPNVLIENCRLYGGASTPSGQTAIIDCNSLAASGLIIKDCEIAAQTPSYYRDGIIGHKFKAFRNHIYNVNDGIGAYAHPNDPTGLCDVELAGNYVHDLVFWKNDPAHTDGTHNDCVQLQGGKNIWVHGNLLINSSVDAPGSDVVGSPTYPGNPKGRYANGQAIQFGQTSTIAKYENVMIEHNWLEMGSVQININLNNTTPYLVGTVRNNIHGRDIFNHYVPNTDRRWIALVQRQGLQITGLETNIFEDTGLPLVEGRATGIRVISE